MKDENTHNVCGIDEHLCNPKPSDWFPFLQQQAWFIPEPDRLAENFPLAIDHLLQPREFRRESNTTLQKILLFLFGLFHTLVA